MPESRGPTRSRASTLPLRRNIGSSEPVTFGIISTTISAMRSAPGWSSSTATRPRLASLQAPRNCASIMPDRIAHKVRAGERLDDCEALELYRDAPTAVLGQLADTVRARKHPQSIV